jgi:UDP-glucose 4-epimerase
VIDALVTGGAGFIGSSLVEALVRGGGRVRVLDDFSSGSRANLVPLGSAVEVVEGDVRDRAAVRRAVAGTRVVFHEAALVSVPQSIADPAATHAVNVEGTRTLLEEARPAGVARVVLASTCAVYGAGGDGPSAEGSAGSFASPYASSKWAMEEMGRAFAANHGLDVVSLRYFNVYGPRQSSDSDYASVIPRFIGAHLRGESATIHGDGQQTRDFVFVDDVVRANLLAADRSGLAGLSLNVGSGRSCSVLALHQELGAILGSARAPRHGPARSGDLRRSRADMTLARARLGFETRVTLREGLSRTVAWYRRRAAELGRPA